MNGEVGLAIAVKIQLAQKDATLNGFFEYAGSHLVSVPKDVARQTNVHRNYSAHVMLAIVYTRPMMLCSIRDELWSVLQADLLPRLVPPCGCQ
jgi:hypothetical protein